MPSAAKPLAALDIGLQTADPNSPLSPAVQQALLAYGLPRTRQLLRHYYCIVVRPMRLRAHRLQLMIGSVTHARRLFGNAVIADEITAALPELAASSST